MDFSNTLFSIAGLVGIIFILVGFVMYKFPPKNINSLYGYRTTGSMSSQEKWDFAQKFSSKLMFKNGLILLGIGLLCYVFKIDETTSVVIGIGSMFAVIIHLLYTTEKKLKQKFDKNETL